MTSATVDDTVAQERQLMKRISHLSYQILLGALVLPSASAAVDEILLFSGDLEQRVCSSHYFARDGSYKIRIPELSNKVIIRDQDIAPRITAHATMAVPDTGFLFLVSTKIRDDLPKDSSILNRVEARMQTYQSQYPNAFSSQSATGPFGRTYEYVMLNASPMNNPMMEGRDPAPYPIASGYRAPKVPGAIERLAIHRYFVAEEYMYEFAVLLHTNGKLANREKADLLALGNEWLNQAIQNFTPGRFTGCGNK
jgi:hypothetical protein